MVHKQTSRPRGRPRQYDPQQALQRATEAFWNVGYSGTSLDQLTDATGMNRPSLYAAFGDKVTLSPGRLSLFDKDGSSIIVHTAADTYCDQESDLKKGCAGGARDACGVIVAMPSAR